jgi:transcriptional regulator with XRE-family HTH domain
MKKYNKHDNKFEFSERLRQSITKHSIPISPTILCKNFNQHHHGDNISIQTASNWLSGVSVPNQDKLQTLANWLSVDIHWLRFGDSVNVPNTPQLSNEQQILVKNFALLSPVHQKIVLDLVNSLIITEVTHR